MKLENLSEATILKTVIVTLLLIMIITANITTITPIMTNVGHVLNSTNISYVIIIIIAGATILTSICDYGRSY